MVLRYFLVLFEEAMDLVRIGYVLGFWLYMNIYIYIYLGS